MIELAQLDNAASGGPFNPTTTWPIIPFPALVGAVAIGFVTALILLCANYFDQYSKGFLTVSILLILAFVTATFASMIYAVPTNPVTEILTGALATALGAIVSHWVGRRPRPPYDETKNNKDEDAGP